MTCIVGIRQKGAVYFGCDSAGAASSPGWVSSDFTIRTNSKVFRNGGFIFGYTSSWRMGDLLRYAFVPPRRETDVDVMKFMCTDFIDGVRTCFKNGGFATLKDGAERGGLFLVGYEGRIFRIDDDYQVGESIDDYEACGCGEGNARGALFATMHLDIRAASRLQLALQAAERHGSGVSAPFNFVSLP